MAAMAPLCHGYPLTRALPKIADDIAQGAVPAHIAENVVHDDAPPQEIIQHGPQFLQNARDAYQNLCQPLSCPRHRNDKSKAAKEQHQPRPRLAQGTSPPPWQ